MDTALVVALMAGGVSLASAAANVWSSRKNAERASDNARALERLRAATEQEREKERRLLEISRYSEPLAKAAYDLQSRIHNILVRAFIDTFLVRGTPREKEYAVQNTAYVISQFFCWSEIVRTDIQLISLEDDDETLKLSHLQDDISTLWSTDHHGPCLRVFSGEQRAIGEALILSGAQGHRCLGYGAFLKTFTPGVEPLVDFLRSDIANLVNGSAPALDRLVSVQHKLIDLLDLLDPEVVRFPRSRRSRVIPQLAAS
jgi:hypothetical protein